MPRELAELWADYQAQPESISLRNELVERYLPYVKILAERLLLKLPRALELEDLIGAGCEGLIESVEAFVPGRGVQFTTYSTLRIRGAMLDELRLLDWVPRRVRLKAKQVATALETLNARLGRQPTPDELANSLQLDSEALEALLAEIQPVTVVSFDGVRAPQGIDWGHETPFVDAMADRSGDLPSSRTERREMFARLCRGLSKTQRLIVICYYFEQMSMKEIGLQLGYSEGRISQAHAEILAHLRRALNRQAPELLSA